MPEYRTLLETYEEMWQPKKVSHSVIIESAENNTIRFLSKNIDASITELDVISHENFDDIMESQLSDMAKVEKLKELILDMFHDNFNKCETNFGVRITADYDFGNVSFYRTNLEKIISDYNKNKEIDAELFGENN